MIPDPTARIDRVLRDLQSLGAGIATRDFGYPVEEATFERGAAAARIEAIAAIIAEPVPMDYSYFLSQCAGFVGMDFHNGYVIHTPEEVVRLFRQAGTPKRVATADGATSVLPVAADGGGNMFLLQLGPQLVLRWDHETGPGGRHDARPHPAYLRERSAPMARDRLAELREFATRYTAAWCTGDAASVAAFFAPGGWLTINGGTPSVGRKAITEAAQGFMTAFPDLKVYMDDLLEKPGKVIYEWTLEGTNTGPGGTGNRVRISGFEEWRLGEDGLVAESLGNFDAAEYERQVAYGVDAK